MSKFVVVSDTHFHDWTEFSKPDEEYVNSRLGEQIRAMEEVFQIARENDADIIFAGDLFHKRQSVNTRVFNPVYEVFEDNSDVTVYGIPGNHDKVSNSIHAESSIDIFNYIENTRISTEIEEIELDDTNLFMVPYGDEVEDIKEQLKEYEPVEGKANILVAHLGVSGSVTGSGGHRLEGAFSYEDLQPDKFDYILLGHYHRPQALQGNGNHVYVGTLVQNNFGEEGHDTGVVIVDTQEETIVRRTIATTKFVTIDGNEIPEDIEQVIDNAYVRFTGNRSQAKALENVVEDMSNIRVNIETVKEVETRIDIGEDMSPTTITEKYMEEYYPDSTEKAVECVREALMNAKV